MWYAACLLFKSTHLNPVGGEGLWEESIRLIEAESAEEAHAKAAALGQRSQVSYAGESGDQITWSFVQIERVYEIDGRLPGDGLEVFSRHLRSSEVESLLRPFDDE